MKGKEFGYVYVNPTEGNASAASAMYIKFKEISKGSCVSPIPYTNILHQNTMHLKKNKTSTMYYNTEVNRLILCDFSLPTVSLILLYHRKAYDMVYARHKFLTTPTLFRKFFTFFTPIAEQLIKSKK